MPEKDEILTVDRLCSGDRPSAYVAGMVVAHALKKGKAAVLMVNALGRVVLMPPESVKILAQPKLQDSELNELEEEAALQLLLQENRPDEEIVEYLKRREVSSNANQSV